MLASLLVVLALLSPLNTPSVSGRWTGVVDLRTTAGESNQVKVFAEFAQKGTKVTGWLGPSAEQRFLVEDGVVENGTLIFHAAMPKRVYTMRLKLAGDDRLEGRCESQDGKAFGEAAFTREK